MERSLEMHQTVKKWRTVRKEQVVPYGFLHYDPVVLMDAGVSMTCCRW